MIQVTLVKNGGEPFYLPSVATLEQAREQVLALDRRWDDWEAFGYPQLDHADPLNFYEGCDVYANGTNGLQWEFNEDEEWAVVEPEEVE